MKSPLQITVQIVFDQTDISFSEYVQIFVIELIELFIHEKLF
jgi:hypothetical protein